VVVDTAEECVERALLLKGIDAWMIADEQGALAGVWDGQQLQEFTTLSSFNAWYEWYLAKTSGTR
jgi:hypothetical protein